MFESSNPCHPTNALAWPPLQILAVNFFGERGANCVWVVKSFLKSAGETFLSSKGGAYIFSEAFRLVFRIFFRVLKIFSVSTSFIEGGQFCSADMLP